MAHVAKMTVNKAVSKIDDQFEKEMAIAMALGIAGADGNIDKDEISVIKEFASALRVNASKFGI